MLRTNALIIRCLAPGAKGRPIKRWFDVTRVDVRANGIVVAKDALDQARWSKLCRKADPGFSHVNVGSYIIMIMMMDDLIYLCDILQAILNI